MKRTKVKCSKCGREISKSNIRKHELSCSGEIKVSYALTHEGLECQFCGKVCKNRNSLCNHERLCRNNPNRQIYSNGTSNGLDKFNADRRAGLVSSWNAGLTKDTDDRVKRNGIAISDYYANHPGAFTGKAHTEDYKKQQRQLALERGLGGFNMRRGILYKDIKLDSSYEVEVAKSLDEHLIRWERCKRFPYKTVDGKLHYYTPDFYLPDYSIYLDPKNDFLINNINPRTGIKDVDKIEMVCKQNNIRVLVLNKNQLSWPVINKLI